MWHRRYGRPRLMSSRTQELLTFYQAFGRMLASPTRYMHKDLAKLVELYDKIGQSSLSRRNSGRPRLEGGWSDRRNKRVAAHVHMCDHACRCDDPERPMCEACQAEVEKLGLR